jgi:hypothetical protein
VGWLGPEKKKVGRAVEEVKQAAGVELVADGLPGQRGRGPEEGFV